MGKRTVRNRLNELYGVSSTLLSTLFLRSSTGPAGEKLQGRKLKHLESSRDAGRQRLPEGSRTTESVPEAMKYDTLLPLGKKRKNKPKSSPPIKRAGTQLLPTVDCGAALIALIRRPLSSQNCVENHCGSLKSSP